MAWYLCKNYKHEKTIICPSAGGGGWCCAGNLCELTSAKELAIYPLPVIVKYETLEYSEIDEETGERIFWFSDGLGITYVKESELNNMKGEKDARHKTGSNKKP